MVQMRHMCHGGVWKRRRRSPLFVANRALRACHAHAQLGTPSMPLRAAAIIMSHAMDDETKTLASSVNSFAGVVIQLVEERNASRQG